MARLGPKALLLPALAVAGDALLAHGAAGAARATDPPRRFAPAFP